RKEIEMELTAWKRNFTNELVDLWNQQLGESFPMRHELFEQNSFNDINICWESSKIALDNAGKVVGFITVKRYQDNLDISMPIKTGWIQAIVVDSTSETGPLGSY